MANTSPAHIFLNSMLSIPPTRQSINGNNSVNVSSTATNVPYPVVGSHVNQSTGVVASSNSLFVPSIRLLPIENTNYRLRSFSSLSGNCIDSSSLNSSPAVLGVADQPSSSNMGSTSNDTVGFGMVRSSSEQRRQYSVIQVGNRMCSVPTENLPKIREVLDARRKLAAQKAVSAAARVSMPSAASGTLPSKSVAVGNQLNTGRMNECLLTPGTSGNLIPCSEGGLSRSQSHSRSCYTDLWLESNLLRSASTPASLNLPSQEPTLATLNSPDREPTLASLNLPVEEPLLASLNLPVEEPTLASLNLPRQAPTAITSQTQPTSSAEEPFKIFFRGSSLPELSAKNCDTCLADAGDDEQYQPHKGLNVDLTLTVPPSPSVPESGDETIHSYQDNDTG